MTSVGLVGAGNWGANWLRTLIALPEANFRWCCELSSALREQIAQETPAIRVTDQLDDLLSDPETKAIVIATPAPTHFKLAKQALEAGKHVMVEKPMALRTAEAVELTELSVDLGLVLMVGHLLEYHPAIPKLRRLLEDGEIGTVNRIESRRSNHGVLRSDENAWWSLAPHDVSMAIRLMGSWPISVHCEGQCLVQSNIEDVVGGTLTFSGGRIARIDVSWHDPAKVRQLKLYGTKKWAVFNDMLPWAEKLTIFDRGFDYASAGPANRRVTTRVGGQEMIALPSTEPLVLEARHFLECVQNGTPCLSDGKSGTAVVSVLEAGQQSIERGREIEIPRPPAGFGLRMVG
jgi:predicted dehydrogenase